MKQAGRVLTALLTPWAIMPKMYEQMLAIYERWVRGETLTPELRAEIEAAIGKPLKNEEKRYTVTPDGIAVIPVQGVISKRMGMFSDISGGASTQAIAADFREALGRPDVLGILFDVDSPGGAVDGTMELAQEIYEARGKKPMATFADGLMASAATWIGTAAEEVYLSAETAQAGSIGVVMVHRDYSGYYEKNGVKNTVITAGKYKAVGNQYEPLSADGRKIIQEDLDYVYSLFVDSVAKNRNTSIERVLEDMADGRIFSGSQAVRAGLVDGIRKRETVIQSLVERASRRQGSSEPGGVAQKQGGAKVDMETLRAQHPDLVAALIAEGKAQGIDDGRAAGIEEGKKLGADAERARIQAVQGCSLKGHEELVKTLMFDGKTSATEAKAMIFDAQKAAQEKACQTFRDQAPEAAAASAGSEQKDAEKQKKEEKEGEPKWRAEFEKDEKLQAQYGGRVESYLAYKKAVAEGKVRELRSRKDD